MTFQPWQLVWHDEFDDAEIDRTRWCLETGYIGASNAEMEIYTDRPENLRLQNGMLVIEARQELLQGYRYTSGRLSVSYTHLTLPTSDLV